MITVTISTDSSQFLHSPFPMEGSTSLELKLLYGKNIRAFNFGQTLSVYVSASISSDDPGKKISRAQQQQQRTPADKDGDGTPEWNHVLQFDLKGIEFRGSDHVFLKLDLFHEGAMFGDKHIGQVHAPLRELIEQPAGVPSFVSYQVKGIDGKPNGILRFAYKVDGVGQDEAIAAIGWTEGISGYPISHHQEDQGSPVTGNPSPGSNLYPKLDYAAAAAPSAPAAPSGPPLEMQYTSPENYYHFSPEGYYPPPPPPPPPAIYPPSHVAGYYYQHAPPPPHHHTVHQHHHSWSPGHDHVHGTYMGGGFSGEEAWRGTYWNGR